MNDKTIKLQNELTIPDYSYMYLVIEIKELNSKSNVKQSKVKQFLQVFYANDINLA